MVVLKHIKEIFLRVNKGVRDGVLPAKEGESLLAFHFEQIEKFLGGKLVEQTRFKGKKERAHGPSWTRRGKITEIVICLGLWGLFWVFFRVLGWVCGALFVGLLGVLSCTVLFSLFPFSIKLFITYQKTSAREMGIDHLFLGFYVAGAVLTLILVSFGFLGLFHVL
jgi:hypothetical protein